MQYKRLLMLSPQRLKKSIFLYGPRQTGKTTLLRTLFPEAPTYNLLHADVFLRLSQRPQDIRERLAGHSAASPVIVDEIQKLPLLLDEVHACIEEFGVRFILTGSSPRKLKRSGANLLGGRARTHYLFPLVSPEIGPDIDLMRIWNFGALPSIYLSPEPLRDLKAYVGNYLQEEIQAEGVVRKIENFSRFLQTAALCNAQLVNFTSVANDARVPPRTIIEYFRILHDTLVGYLLPPFQKTTKRKAIATAKFYFFDIGVSNVLGGITNVQPKTKIFGDVFEHFILTELKAYLAYHDDDRPLTFWRSTHGYEVDFLLGAECAIEVKGTELATERHCTGLHALAEEMPLKHQIIVSLDPYPRRIGRIEIIPVREFLHRLWDRQC